MPILIFYFTSNFTSDNCMYCKIFTMRWWQPIVNWHQPHIYIHCWYLWIWLYIEFILIHLGHWVVKMKSKIYLLNLIFISYTPSTWWIWQNITQRQVMMPKGNVIIEGNISLNAQSRRYRTDILYRTDNKKHRTIRKNYHLSYRTS